MSDIFISYSRKDIAFARLLHAALKDNGFETWIDWQDIPPSADWLVEVYEAIEQADTFVFIISETSVESEVCGLEIAHAARHNKRLIPIVIGDIEAERVPKSLAVLNWIFFEDAGEVFASAVEDLITAISVDQAWVKAHTRLQNRALEWERKGQDRSLLLRGNDLREAEAWLAGASGKDPQPTALQTQYVLASRAESTRRGRLTLAGVGLGLIVAVALGILAWMQRNTAVSESQARATAQAEAQAEAILRATQQTIAETASTQAVQQRDEAERQAGLARAGLYSVESLSHADDDLSLSLLLAVEAVMQADTVQSRSSLLNALLYNPSMVRSLHGHQGPASNVAFSPDGRILVSAGCSQPGPSVGNQTCESAELLFWDVEAEGLVARVPTPHPVFISNLVFSPDGSLLISSDWNGNIVVWDVEAREPKGDPLFDRFGRILDLVFTPDGSSFLSSHEYLSTDGMISGEVRIWDAQTLTLVDSIPLVFTLPYSNILITPDGERMIASQQSSTAITVWDLDTKERIPDVFADNEEIVRSMALSPDGARLIFGTYDGSLMLWDMEREDWLQEPFQAHTGIINDVAYSPDGASFVTVSVDQTIRLWDAVTLEQIGDPFAAQGAEVSDVEFHPSEGQFATACADGAVNLWSPGAKTSLLEEVSGQGEAVWEVAFTSSGDMLATAGVDGSVRIWDVSGSPFLMESLQADIGQIYSLALSADDSLVAAGGQMGIQIWRLETGDLLHALSEGHSLPVVSLAFSTDGAWLASGGMDTEIFLWNLGAGSPVGEMLSGHHATVNDLAFSPDGGQLASVGCGFAQEEFCAGGELILWDLDASPAGSRVVPIHGHNVYALTFSPDGASIATGSMDETIRLWDAASGEQIGDPILGHEGGVTSLAFSPDGTVLASGGFDREIHLTDLASRGRIGPPMTGHTGPVSGLSFSFSGGKLASGSHDGRVFLWEMDISQWVVLACGRAGRNLSVSEWQTYFPGEGYRETCVTAAVE